MWIQVFVYLLSPPPSLEKNIDLHLSVDKFVNLSVEQMLSVQYLKNPLVDKQHTCYTVQVFPLKVDKPY